MPGSPDWLQAELNRGREDKFHCTPLAPGVTVAFSFEQDPSESKGRAINSDIRTTGPIQACPWQTWR